MRSASAQNLKERKSSFALICGVLLAMVVCVLTAFGQGGTVSAARLSEVISRVRSAAPGDEALANARELGQLLLAEKRFAEAAQLFGAVLE